MQAAKSWQNSHAIQLDGIALRFNRTKEIMLVYWVLPFTGFRVRAIHEQPAIHENEAPSDSIDNSAIISTQLTHWVTEHTCCFSIKIWKKKKNKQEKERQYFAILLIQTPFEHYSQSPVLHGLMYRALSNSLSFPAQLNTLNLVFVVSLPWVGNSRHN